MVGAVHRHPWNRLLAWGVDWLCIVVWVGITAAVGIPLYRAGVTTGLSLVTLNVIATLILVVPVTLGLAGLESGGRRASLGKRMRGLRVVHAGTGARVSFWRALARNAMKVAVPWTIGHAAVFGIVASGGDSAVPVTVWLVTAIAYLLPIGYVVTLFIGSGRTPYDRIAGTAVVR
jgi:uncharacterized RDD family membrane protein YckC